MTTRIDSIDKQVCRELRRSMQEALDRMDIEGLTIVVGNMSFSNNKVSVKVTAETAGADEDRSEELRFAMRRHNIATAEIDDHKLVDFHPKKRKYPFIMVGPQGGRYKLSPEQARRRFGEATPQQ